MWRASRNCEAGWGCWITGAKCLGKCKQKFLPLVQRLQYSMQYLFIFHHFSTYVKLLFRKLSPSVVVSCLFLRWSEKTTRFRWVRPRGFAEWPHNWHYPWLYQRALDRRNSTRGQDALFYAETCRLVLVLAFCHISMLFELIFILCGICVWGFDIQWCVLGLKDGEELEALGSLPGGSTVLPVLCPPGSTACESWFWFKI